MLIATQGAQAMEFTDTDNRPVSFAQFRGKPTLMFYEDRDSTKLNQPLKDELFNEGKARGLLGKINLVAIAYLKPFDFFPARGFALSAVRKMEEQFGIQIYVDFNGSVGKELRIPNDNSTVLLFNARGDVVFQRSGKVSKDEVMKAVDQNS